MASSTRLRSGRFGGSCGCEARASRRAEGAEEVELNSLFSPGERTDSSPARHTERTYAFLERCAKRGCQAIRSELERWFEHYPESQRGVLKRRLNADDFSSAFFELYLHELLRLLGLEPELEPNRGGKRPDFVCRIGRHQFALEASVVGGESAQEQGRRAVLNVVFDAINDVPSLDYFFDLVECVLKGSEQPSLRSIKQFVAQQLEVADYATLAVLGRSDIQAHPTWVFDDDKIRLVIRPIPKHDARGELGVRPIGIYPMEGGWIRDNEAIRRRLSEKARQLRSVDGPRVLAINALTRWGTDHDDAVEALFGSEQIVVDVATRQARPSRARDGFLLGPKGPINTRISAVLITSVHPWTTARAGIDVFLNPWAKAGIPEGALPFTLHRAVDGRLKREEGRRPGEVFGLPESWPEECD